MQFFSNRSLSSFFWQGSPLNGRFNTPQVLTDSCFWPKCCRSDSWDLLPYAINLQRTTLYQCLIEEDWLICARNFHRIACWRRLGIVLQKLTPLKDFAGERLSSLCWKLLRLLTKEDRVPSKARFIYLPQYDTWMIPRARYPVFFSMQLQKLPA